jgi:hypothetical protein
MLKTRHLRLLPRLRGVSELLRHFNRDITVLKTLFLGNCLIDRVK